MGATAQLVQSLPAFNDPELLIGAEQFSDAGVYRLAPDLAIVQSVDFFPPLIDDAYVFGQIAAANAMSDVYAMGGLPRTALNIVGFPDDKLDASILADILRGGAERVLAAGAVVVGGHSVRDVEIRLGLAVTGGVHPDRLLTNLGAKPGHALVLTKALGTGFITTALRKKKCSESVMDPAIASMVALNDSASRLAVKYQASAATDITGFGLAGHAHEIAQASGVTLELNLQALPLLPGAIELAERGFLTRANATNRSHVADMMQIESGRDDTLIEFLFDPQTSGGLLLALEQHAAEQLVADLHQSPGLQASIIGSVLDRQDYALRIKS